MGIDPETGVSQFARPVLCRWYFMCTNDATGVRWHSILGDVPICDRCEARVKRLEQEINHV